MSQENIEIVRRGIEAWNRHDIDAGLRFIAPEIEWMPASPAAVERAVYRGYDEVAEGFAGIWETWELFQFDEDEVRDLGGSVLWLGRVHMKGRASQIELDQEVANHFELRDRKIVRVRAYLSWHEALEAVGLPE